MPSSTLPTFRLCEFKYAAASQHSIIMTFQFPCGLPGSEQGPCSAQYISKLPEPIWHEHETYVRLIGAYLGELLRIKKGHGNDGIRTLGSL